MCHNCVLAGEFGPHEVERCRQRFLEIPEDIFYVVSLTKFMYQMAISFCMQQKKCSFCGLNAFLYKQGMTYCTGPFTFVKNKLSSVDF